MQEDEITGLRYLYCIQGDMITEMRVKMEEKEIRHHIEIREKQERVKTMEKILDKMETLKYNGKPFICPIKPFSSICSHLSGGHIPYFQSKPFVQRGYLMCMRMQVGENERVGLFLHIMKSSEDNMLPWPAEINFSISILDQSGRPVASRQDLTVECQFTAADPASQRPQEEINPEGIGHPEVISLDIVNRAPYSNGDIVMVKVRVL